MAFTTPNDAGNMSAFGINDEDQVVGHAARIMRLASRVDLDSRMTVGLRGFCLYFH